MHYSVHNVQCGAHNAQREILQGAPCGAHNVVHVMCCIQYAASDMQFEFAVHCFEASGGTNEEGR